jgi:hypothetical protein
VGISVSFAPAFVRHVLYLKKTLEIRAQYVLYIFPLGILGILNFHFFSDSIGKINSDGENVFEWERHSYTRLRAKIFFDY